MAIEIKPIELTDVAFNTALTNTPSGPRKAIYYEEKQRRVVAIKEAIVHAILPQLGIDWLGADIAISDDSILIQRVKK